MAETATFHFAWVDPDETTFNSVTHAREDEAVFSFEIAQNENEFATAQIEVQRPTEGLLNPSRKQYAWISVTYSAGTVALFFGRVVAFPKNLDSEVVTLEFVAQFPGWEDARKTLFNTLKVAPFWDEAFIPKEHIDDPDQALEARPSLYHYDRTTGAITLSNVLVGGSSMTVSDQPSDSLTFDVTDNPAQKITVTASVGWEQRIIGDTRINLQVDREFDGNRVNTFTPDALERAWPKVGDTIGGQSGYTVVESSIDRLGALASGMAQESSTYKIKISDIEQAFAKATINTAAATRDSKITRVWYNTTLGIGFDFAQSRSETLTFTLENDVQPLAFGADGGETKINLQSEDVISLGLMPARWSSYFLTTAGKASFHYLLARAQAAAAMAARAVEIGFQRPLFDMVDITCDHSVTLTDERIPGGTATGKVKSYRLVLDGQTGEAVGSAVLGVSVGNGIDYTAGSIAGYYCNTSYVGLDYQAGSGETYNPDIPAIIYEDYSGQLPDDPPIINRLANRNIVQSLSIDNGPDVQQQLLQDNQHPVRDDAADVVSQNPTVINLELRSLEPFDDVEHTITVAIAHPWAAPKGVDLAA